MQRNPLEQPADLHWIVYVLFFALGCIASLNDVIIPKLKALFVLPYVKIMLIQAAFFCGVPGRGTAGLLSGAANRLHAHRRARSSDNERGLPAVRAGLAQGLLRPVDRKSTRLNSSHRH